jgi:hypothetical protein
MLGSKRIKSASQWQEKAGFLKKKMEQFKTTQ